MFYARGVIVHAETLGPGPLCKDLRQQEKRRYIGITLFDRSLHALNLSEVIQLVDRHPVIVLRRSNMLHAYCSYQQANLTGIWHRDEQGHPIQWRG